MLISPEEFLSSLSFDLPAQADASLSAGERAFVEKYLGISSEELSPQLKLQPVEPEPETYKPVLPPPVIKIAPETPTPSAATSVEKSPLIIQVVEEEKDVSPKLAEDFELEKNIELQPETKSESQQDILPEKKADSLKFSLKEKLKAANEIQLVSFFIAEQLFLLPVEAIHEVVRHLELVKIPQAPSFIAGAINLRGAVLPLIHLSALLTNGSVHEYDEKKFIIICGSETMRLGLVIDRISGMHWLGQEKIIWNMESKLGDSGEFLYAIADLNDKVCGIVDPDSIAQKILSP